MPFQLSQNELNAPRAQACRLLSKAVRTALHAAGLLVRSVPKTVNRQVRRYWDQQQALDADIEAAPVASLRHKRLLFVKNVTQAYRQVLRHVCRPPVSSAFTELVLTGGQHDDVEVMLGLHFGRMPAGGFQYGIASVATVAAADQDDYIDPKEFRKAFKRGYRSPVGGDATPTVKLYLREPGTNAGGAAPTKQQLEAMPINQMLRSGRVAEVDLVCAANADEAGATLQVPGSGRALLMQALVRAAQVRKSGRPRYSAVLTHLAYQGQQRPPLRSAVESLQFVPVDSWWVSADAPDRPPVRTQRKYYVLRDEGTQAWVSRIAQALNWQGEVVEGLCPLRARAGVSACT